MKIEHLFQRDIFRAINGVVKADQLDASSVWQELDEFVLTQELNIHLRNFVTWLLDPSENPRDKQASEKMGVWISGFFGSGKSHFLKVLSYLLHNQSHSFGDQAKRAVEFFDSKVPDALFLTDIKRAVANNTDVVLFNIDSKADHRTSRDLILRVFLKVLNELQGYSGDHPHIAHLERYLQGRSLLTAFHDAYRGHTGLEWIEERDAYQFNRDEVVKVLSETLGQSPAAAEKWIDGAEDNFSLTVENFAKWVKAYLDSKGPSHRLVFLVDEVGQFIGTDSHLMLNLQTITEELGTICKRRAWVIVTSQEDMDAVLGDMSKAKQQDFSKIQGRFFPPLSLSSANVDEVIQSRLLAKKPEVNAELEAVFNVKGDILKSHLTFTNVGMTFRKINSAGEFARNYPFVPYQFQLLQKIFEAIRKAGATGAHLARGERSMLDAFQSAARTVSGSEVGVLVPLYDFYPSIESFLDTTVKKTIDQAGTNPSLTPKDVQLLQVLFLIRYVEEMQGNVDNLVTLCMNEIDGDRLTLRRSIEEGLGRLEKETLISRNGDTYLFLTNEERDINREIKSVELSSSDESALLGEIIFDDVLKSQRRHRFSGNQVYFDINRRCDAFNFGNQKDGALLFTVYTPLGDDYDLHDNARCILNSTHDGGMLIFRLGNDEGLGRELRTCIQTTKYVGRKNDGTLPESARRILRESAEGNRIRRDRLKVQIERMLAEASVYAAGQTLKLKATKVTEMIAEATEYLIQNTFSKMGLLKRLTNEEDRLREIQAVLRSNDVAKEQLLFENGDSNPDAIKDVREYLALSASASRQVVLHDMLEKRYSVRPYGWPEDEVLLLLARLVVLGDVSLSMDAAPLQIDKIYDAITATAKRRKIVVAKRTTGDPEAVRKARQLGQDLFAQTGPDGADGLCNFLQSKLRDWHRSATGFQAIAAGGAYPGGETLALGVALTNRLLPLADSYKFFEQFNAERSVLLDFADQFNDLTHFFTHQRTLWDRLRTVNGRFLLNRHELDRNTAASAALKRIREVLESAVPYGAMKEVESLIETVNSVNQSLIAGHRAVVLSEIDQRLTTLRADIDAAAGDASLKQVVLSPLERLRKRVEADESIAHIAQAQTQAIAEHDEAVTRIEEFTAGQTAKAIQYDGSAIAPKPPAVMRKQRIVHPAKLVLATYLETPEQVTEFLSALRIQLEAALANNERIQIR